MTSLELLVSKFGAVDGDRLWKRFVGLWPETRREIVRTIEHHHGIKGGQHVNTIHATL